MSSDDFDLPTLRTEPRWHREQRLLDSHHGQRVAWRTADDQEHPVISASTLHNSKTEETGHAA